MWIDRTSTDLKYTHHEHRHRQACIQGMGAFHWNPLVTIFELIVCLFPGCRFCLLVSKLFRS